MRTTDFTFKAKWVKAISLLPADYQALATNAIITYAYFGTLPQDALILSFITLIIDEIDRETRRRDRISERKAAQPKVEPAAANPCEPVSESETPPDPLVHSVRKHICNHPEYSGIMVRKIVSKSRDRAEAYAKLDSLITLFISRHPKYTDPSVIARVLCGQLEQNLLTPPVSAPADGKP